MKINLDIKFESGAKVILTKEETQKVADFISKMLFETPVTQKLVVKRRSRRGQKPVKWTTEDLLKIKQILSLPKHERNNAYKALAPTINRSCGAIKSQAFRIEKGLTELPPLVISSFTERLMSQR